MPYSTIYAVLWFVQSCAGCFPRLPVNPSWKGAQSGRWAAPTIASKATVTQVKLLNIQHHFAQPLIISPTLAHNN